MDANLNENIGEHTDVVDEFHNEKDLDCGHVDGHNQEAHLDPARWWFASAAFPMVAGTLGPVASAFSVCALVKEWRQRILPGSDVTKAVFIRDPPWLIAINAVQLTIAVVANVFLLLNMTKRVRFSIAQPITIAGWYISSILLIALCATASGPLALHPEIDYVWSQAFYYGLFAAIIYFIIASLMVITVWGAETGHYPKDFELTMSQRTLMLQTILFLIYLLLGALVFSHIEGWLYLDAVYWADYTLFTVGFGDLSLTTNLSRGLVIPYALIGITSLGLVIGSIRSLMLDKGKSRLDSRMLEKKRRKFVRRLMRKGRGKALLEPITDGDADYYPNLKSQDSQDSQDSLEGPSKAELERRYNEFHLMRKIQDQAARRRRWQAVTVSFSTWVVLWLVGAKIFQVSELPYQGWSYFDAIYFSFQAATTIGYGDITPVSNPSKAFFVFWSLLALPTLTVLISHAGDTVVKEIRDATLMLGNITILPGERGFKTDIRQLLSRLSFGALFTDKAIHESPPGFLGAAQPHSDSDEEGEPVDDESRPSEDLGNKKSKRDTRNSRTRDPSSPDYRDLNRRDTESSKLKAPNDQTEHHQSTPSKWTEPLGGGKIPGELPKTRAEYHLVLIDEIRRVTLHLKQSPPRRYTYQEWAWYLRLIGEDESDASTHRKPPKKPRKPDAEREPQPAGKSSANAATANNQQDRPKWSWVGHRSPLMDTREEAEWILDKLCQKLRDELRAIVEENEGEDGVRSVASIEEEYHRGSGGDNLV
ncbi:voltage-gated potassium channel [Xylariaceae sp. FL1651]|nr:voltage-gated potassium channel [Xylariaceae sp. FL1651]